MNLKAKLQLGLVILFFLFVHSAYPQGGKVEEALRKKEKVERSYEKAYERARKKTIKHRKEIQTKDTRTSMKEADKRARQYNKQGNKGLIERFISKRKSRK